VGGKQTSDEEMRMGDLGRKKKGNSRGKRPGQVGRGKKIARKRKSRARSIISDQKKKKQKTQTKRGYDEHTAGKMRREQEAFLERDCSIKTGRMEKGRRL